MNLIGFIQHWIDGIKNITPAQQLHAKMMGQIGAIIGATGATITLVYKGLWYWSPFMLFIIFLQLIEYIGTRQQYIAIRKIINEQKEFINNFKEIQ